VPVRRVDLLGGVVERAERLVRVPGRAAGRERAGAVLLDHRDGVPVEPRPERGGEQLGRADRGAGAEQCEGAADERDPEQVRSSARARV
jgi:hypothetical protein